MLIIKLYALVSLFIFVSTNALAEDGVRQIYCGQMLDVESGEIIDGVMISVDDETEKIIDLNSNIQLSATDNTLDLSDHFCLPGLIDMHTHISEKASSSDLSEFLTRTQDQQLIEARENAQTTLEVGFTTIRDVGVYIAWTDRRLRDEINQGLTPGPRIQISGYYLTIPGGGGDIDIPDYKGKVPEHIRQGVTQGKDQFRQRAEKAVAGGADLLKMIASGAVLAYGSIPGSPEMNPDEIQAVVDVGHQAGIRVTAHAHGAESIKQAILAGVDSIEHASLIDDEGIRLAKEKGVALSLSLIHI